jgi:inosine-uridine nucleoside N-ribohydrolase/formylmethanofuran dehydrogenase subunit E
MRSLLCVSAALACLIPVPVAVAHEAHVHGPVVVDTDLGLDDAVALAMALQSSDLDLRAIVAVEGVLDREDATRVLGRLAGRFHRGDLALHAPAPPDDAGSEPGAAPLPRLAADALERALAEARSAEVRPFDPRAYTVDEGRTTILALGPLTNIAAAIEARPQIVPRIARVVLVREPDDDEAWNVARDPEAFRRVVASGVDIVTITPHDDTGAKAVGWRDGLFAGGPNTAVGESFVDDLLRDETTRRHYREALSVLHDELAVLFAIDESLFRHEPRRDVWAPLHVSQVARRVDRELFTGRQRKQWVVFRGEFPRSLFRKDVQPRIQRIIDNNGEQEWYAQIMLNELHNHLGAYSIIGVKMGLRAAELLNAPQTSMRVVSYAPDHPPVSCLNDGLMVATGSTTGRMLFTHEPKPTPVVAARFEHEGRVLQMTLRAEHVQRIRSTITKLRERHGLEDHEYWDGVRELGLNIWETWHRTEIFDVEWLGS